MAVFFHGNFGLHRPRMSKLLERALNNHDMTDEGLAEPFGYRAPFAQRYRSWLHKTGIIELRFPVELTEKGAIVYENDPEFVSLTTQWFMHWELSTDPTRAEAWYFFINEFLPFRDTFIKNDLLEGVMMKLRSHSEEHFGPDSKLNPVIVRKLIECYTTNYSLGALGILVGKNTVYHRGTDLEPAGPWETISDLYQVFV